MHLKLEPMVCENPRCKKTFVVASGHGAESVAGARRKLGGPHANRYCNDACGSDAWRQEKEAQLKKQAKAEVAKEAPAPTATVNTSLAMAVAARLDAMDKQLGVIRNFQLGDHLLAEGTADEVESMRQTQLDLYSLVARVARELGIKLTEVETDIADNIPKAVAAAASRDTH